METINIIINETVENVPITPQEIVENIPITVEEGRKGREVEIQNNGTYIQWRYVGDVEWNNIESLENLTGDPGVDGREVQLRVNDGYVQWKYNTDTEWVNFFFIADYIPYIRYTINFNANSDVSAFYSKHAGNISKIETNNVTSYTINGAAETLPYSIALDKHYMFNIVKTSPGTASLTITVKLDVYSETIELPDFTVGNGEWLYALGDTTNLNTLYRYDSSKLESTNYAGAGTWTTSPLISTINLPVLPTNGYWSQMTYLKDGWMLIAGGNTANNQKYFCKVSTLSANLDQITDLAGTVGVYTTLTTTSTNYNRPYMNIYDYINNKVYYFSYGSFTTYLVDAWYYLDLSTNTVTKITPIIKSNSWNLAQYYNKIYYNPYNNSFSFLDQTFCLNENKPIYNIAYSYINYKVYFNVRTKLYYLITENDRRRLSILDSEGNYIGLLAASGTNSGTAIGYSVDYDNNDFIQWVNFANIYIRRTFNAGGYYYTIPDPEGASTYCTDFIALNNRLHIGLSSLFGRAFIIDMKTAPTTSGYVGYINFPGKVWNIHTNKMLI